MKQKMPFDQDGRIWTAVVRWQKMEHMSMSKTRLRDRRRRRRQESVEVNQVTISLCIVMLVNIHASGFDCGWSWSEMTRRKKLGHASPSKIRHDVVRKRPTPTARN
jgi:hypothetical protein